MFDVLRADLMTRLSGGDGNTQAPSAWLYTEIGVCRIPVPADMWSGESWDMALQTFLERLNDRVKLVVVTPGVPQDWGQSLPIAHAHCVSVLWMSAEQIECEVWAYKRTPKGQVLFDPSRYGEYDWVHPLEASLVADEPELDIDSLSPAAQRQLKQRLDQGYQWAAPCRGWVYLPLLNVPPLQASSNPLGHPEMSTAH